MRGTTFLCLVLLLASPGALQAVTLPPGFVAQEVGSSGTWEEIVGLDIAPDGRLFVIEKRGRVHIVEDNVKLPVPFLDIEDEVLNNGDRGLLGIALDPRFSENGHVYLLYTVDPNGDGVDDEIPAFSRLTRYTAVEGSPNVADPASRRVLIGSSWSTGIPSVYETHTIGALHFAPDGSLLLSSGESSHSDRADAGGRDPAAFGTGKTPLSEDIGSFRAQWIGSLGGKILRVDPATGGGLPSNPYFTGNPLDNASRVWAYGLRNPFRFCIRPGTGSLDPAAGRPGTLYIADVGWKTWEEVSVSEDGGENFGWPCREGPVVADDYPSLHPPHHGCGTIGSADNPENPMGPLIDWHHTSAGLSSPAGLLGKCVAGIAFYAGDSYPAPYRGACFVAEYDKHWIRATRVDSRNDLVEVLDFATDTFGPVDLVADPASGDLYYISILRNEIRRIRYDISNSPPAAQASGTPLSGAAPLTVSFSSAGSSDPDGDPITHSWSFGDGTTSSTPNPTHEYTRAGSFTAILTVDDGRGGQGSAQVDVTVTGGQPGNQAPVPSILAPGDDSLYLPQAEVTLQGTAEDEDPLEDLRFTWEVVLHHNTHVHPAWLTLSGRVASFVPRDHDDGTGIWLEIVLRVSDRGGLTGIQRVSIFPPRTPLVLDNGDPGTSSTGSWPVSDSISPHGADSLFSKTTGGTYTYHFDLPEPGMYRVYAWWTYANTRTTAAPYRIQHAQGNSTVLVDQSDLAAIDIWNDLGAYPFGATARVTITAVGGTATTCADAVALLPLGSHDPPPTAYIDSISPSPATSGQPVSFTGHGQDNGTIAAYRWSSNLQGFLSDQPAFEVSSLSMGIHTIFFRVEDDEGNESEDAKMVLQVNPRTAVEVIVDNGQEGTSSSGTWSLSAARDAYGQDSVYSKRAGDTYTFGSAIREPGVYDVHAWWTSLPGRAPAAAYTTSYATGSRTITVDQRLDGGGWGYLGTYRFESSASVVLSSPGGAMSACADAVRLVQLPDDVIIDNGDPGTSSTGDWSLSSGKAHYGLDSLFSKSAAARYTYSIPVARPGRYEVLAWWTTTTNRTTRAPYTVVHATGTASLSASQRTGGGRWNSLGAYSFSGSAVVTVEGLGDRTSSSADAIRLHRLP